MKKGFAMLLVLVMAAGLCAGLAGCAAAPDFSEGAPSAVAPSMPEQPKDSAAPQIAGESGTSAFRPAGEQKLIQTGRIRLETMDYAKSCQELLAAVSAAKGYVEHSSETGDSRAAYEEHQPYRSGNYTLRIPQTEYAAFFESGLADLGHLVYKQSSVEDVTGAYMDLEARLKTLKTQEARLLTMLEQAEKMEDLIALEGKLSEVRYTIESYESQWKALDQSIAYCTLEVELREVARYSEGGGEGLSFFGKVGYFFQKSLTFLGRFAQGTALAVVFLAPILALPILALVAVVLLLRRKKNRGKQAEEPSAPRADTPKEK